MQLWVMISVQIVRIHGYDTKWHITVYENSILFHLLVVFKLEFEKYFSNTVK